MLLLLSSCTRLKQRWYKVTLLVSFCFLLSSPLLLLPLSGVQLQLLPRLPGAHAVRWGAELPAAASRRRQQPDLARRPRPEDSTHTHRQAAAAARHRGHPGMRTSIQTDQRRCGEGFFPACEWLSNVFFLPRLGNKSFRLRDTAHNWEG